MTDFLLFLVAAALGLWVLNRGAPWARNRRREDRTIAPSREKTIHFSGERL